MLDAARPNNSPSPTPANAGVAVDVRRLITQAEHGKSFDLEWTGHAFDVHADMAEALQQRIGTESALAHELEQRIENFARTSATANMYLRLVISDEMPDLPDYSPCQISVYDGVQNTGTDFSKVIQRSTVYGTLMTSVSMSDLRAYFESGRKRHLLVYMGTDRMGDLKANDKILAQLPAILEAAGMGKEAIAEILQAIKGGDMPPVVLKMLHQAIEISTLRAAIATTKDAPPEAKAQLAKIETQFKTLLARVQSMPSIASIFAKAFTAILVTPSVVARIIAHNDNKPANLQTAKELRQEIRALARDKTTITPEQRRELALILRELRAGIASTATAKLTPQPARIPAAIIRLNAMIAPLVLHKNSPVFIQKLAPLALRTTLALATPSFITTTVKPLVMDNLRAQSTPLPVINRIEQVFQHPKVEPLIARSIQNPEILKTIPPEITAAILHHARAVDMIPPVITPIVEAKNQIAAALTKTENITVQPNLVNVKERESKALETQEKQEPSKKSACGAFCRCAEKASASETKTTTTLNSKADVASVFGSDVAARVTVEEARTFIQNIAKADAIMETSGLKTIETSNAQLAHAIAGYEASKNSSGGHICTAFCNHAKSDIPPHAAPEALKSDPVKLQDAATIKKMKFEP